MYILQSIILQFIINLTMINCAIFVQNLTCKVYG